MILKILKNTIGSILFGILSRSEVDCRLSWYKSRKLHFRNIPVSSRGWALYVNCTYGKNKNVIVMDRPRRAECAAALPRQCGTFFHLLFLHFITAGDFYFENERLEWKEIYKIQKFKMHILNEFKPWYSCEGNYHVQHSYIAYSSVNVASLQFYN